MKAVLMSAPGEADVLRLQEIPAPVLSGDEDILVRLKAAGVNPVDTKLRAKGTYYPDNMPAILGCDGAGIVEAVGKNVDRFEEGDEVYFCNGGIGGHPGTYAEYATVHQDFAAHKPASLDFATAAAAPLVLITAWESLHDRAGMKEEQKVLIHAGAGGVGHVAIQLAKAAGCEVITTVSRAEKAAFVARLGADKIVEYREQDFVKETLEWTGGKGVDIGFDTVGGTVFEQTFRAVRPYGDVISLLQPGVDTDWKHARLRNLRISLELMLSPMYFGWHEAQRHQAWILEQCSKLFDEDRLRIHISLTLPLEQAAEAHRFIEQGGMVGKIALLMD